RHRTDYHTLMDDTERLLRQVLLEVVGTARPRAIQTGKELRFDAPLRKVRWVDAFAPYIDGDPLTATRDQWAHALSSHGIAVDTHWDRDTVLSMFWAEVIEPTFGDEAIFLIEFPADQA